MAMASLDKLKGRRVAACQRFNINVRQHPPLMSIDPPPPSHVQSETSRTNRLKLNDFATVNILYNCVCLLLAYPAIQSMLQLGKIN